MYFHWKIKCVNPCDPKSEQWLFSLDNIQTMWSYKWKKLFLKHKTLHSINPDVWEVSWNVSCSFLEQRSGNQAVRWNTVLSVLQKLSKEQ